MQNKISIILLWETHQEDKLVIDEMFNDGIYKFSFSENVPIDFSLIHRYLLNSTYGALGVEPSFDIKYTRKMKA
jgi:hypothetical protein